MNYIRTWLAAVESANRAWLKAYRTHRTKARNRQLQPVQEQQ